MSKASGPNRFLHKRANPGYCQRRTPAQFAGIDPRGLLKASLKTKSPEVARLRRDHLAEADDQYWMALAAEAASPSGRGPKLRSAVEHRYTSAIARAMRRSRSISSISTRRKRQGG